MAALVIFMVLIFAMPALSSGTWCVCKDGSDAVLQKTLDYACGAGADCTLIHQNGACFNPNTLRAHCNYAVNSYFQRKAQAAGSCDFAGSATITTSDPSTTGCVYSASASTTPVTTMPSTTTPTGSSPYVTTPSTGALGGVGTGLGPSGVGINTDNSYGGVLLLKSSMLSFFVALMFSGLLLLWG